MRIFFDHFMNILLSKFFYNQYFMIFVVIFYAYYWCCIILVTFKIASKVWDSFYWCSFVLHIVTTVYSDAAAIRRHSVQFS